MVGGAAAIGASLSSAGMQTAELPIVSLHLLAACCSLRFCQGINSACEGGRAAVFTHIHAHLMGMLGVQLDRNVGEPPHHTQHDCTSQQGRLLGYQPPPYDQTPCYLNEKTCSRHFAQTNVGANVTVTFDWKHLMYEDYDRALFETWKKEGGPHYVILSPGISRSQDPLLISGDTAALVEAPDLLHG